MKRVLKRVLQTVAVGSFAILAATLTTARPAHALEERSCNQDLVDCTEQAAATFDCCIYAADPTTTGYLCEYLPDFKAPAVPPGATATKCIAQLNGANSKCQLTWLGCTVFGGRK